MKSKITLTTLACALFVSTAALAQESSQGVSLATVRVTFRKADADGDGAISAREAARARIPGKHFVAHDVDANRNLSQEEFVAYYRELLVKAGLPVGKDLEAEVARVETHRRAKLAEQELERQRRADQTDAAVVAQGTAEKLKAAQGTLVERAQGPGASRTGIQQAIDALGPTGTSSLTTSQKLKRAKDALEGRWQATEEPREKVQRAVDVLEERAAAVQAPVQTLARVETPARIETPPMQVAATDVGSDSGATVADETADADGLSVARRKLIERARNARTTDAPTTDPTPGQPVERARVVLRRLVDGGRITPDQARDFDAMLADRASTATAGNATPIADMNALRVTLRRAQAQVKGQLDSGAMTVEEARLVNDALLARARIIATTLPAEARASVPVEPVSVRQETRRVPTGVEATRADRESSPAQAKPTRAQGEAPARGREPAGGSVRPRDAEARGRPVTEPPPVDARGAKPADAKDRKPADAKGAKPRTRKASESEQKVTPPPVRGEGQRGGEQNSDGRRSGGASDGGRRVGGEA